VGFKELKVQREQSLWSCISCGQMNSTDRNNCEICSIPKPGGSDIKKRKEYDYPDSNGDDERNIKKAKNEWKCTFCGTDNNYSICANPSCLRIRSGFL